MKYDSRGYWLLLLTAIVCMCCFIWGFMEGGGFIKEPDAISFECNAHTSKQLNRNGCNASIFIQGKEMMLINSNFDTISVLGDAR